MALVGGYPVIHYPDPGGFVVVSSDPVFRFRNVSGDACTGKHFAPSTPTAGVFTRIWYV